MSSINNTSFYLGNYIESDSMSIVILKKKYCKHYFVNTVETL